MPTTFVPVYNGELSDAAQLNQLFGPVNALERGLPFYGGTTTGSVNAHVLALDPAMTDLAAGQVVSFMPGYANTGAATLNVGTGIFDLLKNGAALVEGDLLTTAVYWAVFGPDDNWHLIGGSGSGGGGGSGSAALPLISRTQADGVNQGGSGAWSTVDNSGGFVVADSDTPFWPHSPGLGLSPPNWAVNGGSFKVPAGVSTVRVHFTGFAYGLSGGAVTFRIAAYPHSATQLIGSYYGLAAADAYGGAKEAFATISTEGFVSIDTPYWAVSPTDWLAVNIVSATGTYTGLYGVEFWVEGWT